VQRMSAGTGVAHSEYNPSESEGVHLLQIWIMPRERNLPPGYEQKAFTEDERRGRWRLVASPDGRDGSVTIQQDARLYATIADANSTIEHSFDANRYGWAQVARGTVSINDVELKQGDGAALRNESLIKLTAHDDAEVLLFDLA
jgi:redox-sensitive bicupin YhaK (pirin superfamily)